MLASQDFDRTHSPDDPDEFKRVVLSELQTILDSAAFRTSLRAREFLSYVVHETLNGNSEALKERSIGINLYHRSPAYITGDDPVVRVKAGEVRRRLLKYYEQNPVPGLRIELPLGSYVPHFNVQAQPEADLILPGVLDEVDLIDSSEERIPLHAAAEIPQTNRRYLSIGIVTLAVIAALSGVIALHRSSSLRQFWKPLLSERTPVLVCLPSPVSYALSTDLAKRLGQPQSAPDEPQLLMDTLPVKLSPDAVIKSSDLTPLIEYNVNKDDAYTLAEVSKVFARLGQNDQTRIGEDLTFADLRSSPAVLIGAFDNPWTLKMSRDLPYRFKEIGEIPLIEDRADPSRTWRPEPDGRRGSRDFAIVARLLNSKSGQPMVIIAGTGMAGTEAAGRALCNEEALRQILASLPHGWAGKNVEIVLETDQVDGSSSRSQVVASSTW